MKKLTAIFLCFAMALSLAACGNTTSSTNESSTPESSVPVSYTHLDVYKRQVVWCPKYRRKVLTNGVDTRLKELLTEYAANLSVEILEMEIMPDHVHMLLEVEPQFGIHKAVKSFKGYTSRILRQEFPYLKTKMPTLWTNSYFVSTVGGAPLEAVKQYIENQKTSQRQKDKMG